MHGLVEDLGVAIFASSVVGYILLRLKQSTILAYLIVGVIIGPEIGPSFITNTENIETISELGLILLLFIIGLEMQPSHLISVFKKVYLAGIGQFLLTLGSGVLIFSLTGFALVTNNMQAFYLAIAASLSSTAIVIKLLNDKAELDSFSGRLTVGILLFQDVWAILMLAIQPDISSMDIRPIVMAILKAFALIAIAFLLSKYLLKRIFESIVRSPEMIVTLSIGWCSFVVGCAELMHLSLEMGALIAGVAISTYPYSLHVTSKVITLRDFFLTLFFISLGMKIPIPEVEFFWPVFGLITFTMLSRLLTIIPLGRLSGSSLRNTFVASINLAQISEFSLVIAAIGLSLGHIQKDTMAIILYSMSITSIVSSYLIKYNYQIYSLLEPFLKRIKLYDERSKVMEKDESKSDAAYPITVLGYHRGAQSLIELLSKDKPEMLSNILVLDFNLESIRELKLHKIHHRYGDISHFDTLEQAGIEHTKVIISTIPDILLKGTSNIKIVKTCRSLNPEAFIIATADLNHQISELKVAGANEVLLPYYAAASHLTEILHEIDKEGGFA